MTPAALHGVQVMWEVARAMFAKHVLPKSHFIRCTL